MLFGEEEQVGDRGGDVDSNERFLRAVSVAVTVPAALQDQGGEKRDQESACGGGKPNAGEETTYVGDDQGDGGEHRRMGGRGG